MLPTNDAPRDPGPRATRPRAVNLFAPIHKALRLALAETLVRIGQTPLADDDAARALLDDVDALLHKLDRHAEVEDAIIAPALAGRAGEVFATHACLDRLAAEVRALVTRARTVRADDREVVGRTLYLHFGRLVSEHLSHMAEEEQVLQPLLEWMHGDDALIAVHTAMLAAFTPDEKLASAQLMLWAASPSERVALVRGFSAGAGPAVATAVLQRSAARLSAAELAHLLSLTAAR